MKGHGSLSRSGIARERPTFSTRMVAAFLPFWPISRINKALRSCSMHFESASAVRNRSSFEARATEGRAALFVHRFPPIPQLISSSFSRLVLLSVRAHCVAVNDSMRFVIAGLGWWGRSWTDVLKIHPKVQLVATVDPSTGAGHWSRENLAVAHFPDLNSAFREIDADAVLVTTAPQLTCPVLLNT